MCALHATRYKALPPSALARANRRRHAQTSKQQHKRMDMIQGVHTSKAESFGKSLAMASQRVSKYADKDMVLHWLAPL